MTKIIILGAILGLLLISMPTTAFTVPSIKKSLENHAASDCFQDFHTVSTDRGGHNWGLLENDFVRHNTIHQVIADWDFDKPAELGAYACVDDDSLEVVIGISDECTYGGLTNFVTQGGCCLIDEIQIKDDVVALVVDVPLTKVSSFMTQLDSIGALRYVEPNMIFNASIMPNDNSWKRQWGPSKIGAADAWNFQIGNASVLVAVVDTGIDWDHPDLSANYAHLGYDWVNDDSDPMDDNGHGTHCAGIIAATLSNGIGVAGLAQVGIMAEKALNAAGMGYEDDLAKAVIHAVDQGAKIISMSWGGYVRSELVYDAVKYAYDSGVLLVAAAGNEATDRLSYPATFEEVIAVAATDQLDNPAYFTNFGNWIELAAPGVDIYSTVWDNTYEYFSGTSMACPHVAGVAALVWSQFPSMSRDQLRLRLRQTADDLGELGPDEYYGYGRVNVKAAVEDVLPEHDLIIEHWETPLVARPDTDWFLPVRHVEINGTVSNFGKKTEEDITIHLLANDTVIDTATIDYLECNTSHKVTLSWSLAIPEGTYNVTIRILPTPDEDVVRNNFFSAYVLIKEIRVIRVPEQTPSIQDAIDSASPEDLVAVDAGTYYEEVSITKPIMLVSTGSSAAIVNGNGEGTIVEVKAVDNVYIAGFSLVNGTIGISLHNSYTILRGINLSANEHNLQVSGRSLRDFVHSIDATNKANEKPVHYLVNQKDRVVSADAGHVGIVNSTNITVKNLSLNEELLLAYSTDSLIENVSVSRALYGIRFFWSSNNTVCMSTFWGNTHGIYLRNSNDNKVADNNATLNQFNGIWTFFSAGNRFNSNVIENNFEGINLMYSTSNSLTDNRMKNNQYSFDVYGNHLSHFIHDIDNSNTVDGKIIYYMINQCSIVVDPCTFPNAGYLGLVNSTGLTVQNLSLNGCIHGVLLVCTHNSTIRNLTISECNTGILLFQSSVNRVSTNVILDSWHGIDLERSYNNELNGNIIGESGEGGIYIHQSDANIIAENTLFNVSVLAMGIESSDENIVSRNNMLKSYCAIAFGFSTHNSINANNLTDNGLGIIAVWASSNNIVYHNNLINNSRQVLNFETRNVWDNDYPLGGNYWSDYSGLDLKWGANQDQSGSDGIGDTAYMIDANNKDEYPFMAPWTFSPPSGPGDVNGDGKVNIYDVVLASAAYGSKPGEPNWNSCADVASPWELINIYDIVTIASNYGKEYR